MRLTIAPNCAAYTERVHHLLRRQSQSCGSTRRGREHTDGRARMPALHDVLLAHALTDAGADLVARDGGAQELAAAHARLELGHGKERRQGHGTHMQHALTMDVVELEALHQRAVHKCGMRRRQPHIGAPYATAARAVDRAQRPHQDAAPFELGVEQRAAERIQHQKLDAVLYFLRYLLVGEPRDKGGEARCVRIGACPVAQGSLLSCRRPGMGRAIE
jgi:hypothetical protein